MRLVQGYTQSILVPQLRSLGLDQRQRKIVAEDVTQRLESLLSHWSDVPFRRTVLAIGNEEATFWEPSNASLDIRSLVVVAVRNSLVTDLNATRAYTNTLRSPIEFLPDHQMPWITGEAINYFQAANLDTVQVHPKRDLFGSLPRRFPNAWHVLSLLGNSSESEITCNLPMTKAEPVDFSGCRSGDKDYKDVEAGFDPSLNDYLAAVLRKIERKDLGLFFSLSFKWITRNPEKLLAIIDHILRFGGTVVTPNYLLSPVYLARRHPLLRPAHFASEIAAQASQLGWAERAAQGRTGFDRFVAESVPAFIPARFRRFLAGGWHLYRNLFGELHRVSHGTMLQARSDALWQRASSPECPTGTTVWPLAA